MKSKSRCIHFRIQDKIKKVRSVKHNDECMWRDTLQRSTTLDCNVPPDVVAGIAIVRPLHKNYDYVITECKINLPSFPTSSHIKGQLCFGAFVLMCVTTTLNDGFCFGSKDQIPTVEISWEFNPFFSPNFGHSWTDERLSWRKESYTRVLSKLTYQWSLHIIGYYGWGYNWSAEHWFFSRRKTHFKGAFCCISSKYISILVQTQKQIVFATPPPFTL